MVICIKCWIHKDNSEFYKHKQTIDWILHKCKDCVKQYQKEKDNSLIDRIREQTPKRKEWKKSFLKQFRIDNPEKVYAQRKVAGCLRKYPELKPIKCAVTWVEWVRLHLHHFDYTKPNEVIPCTPKIHTDFHRWIITEIKEEWKIILPFK